MTSTVWVFHRLRFSADRQAPLNAALVASAANIVRVFAGYADETRHYSYCEFAMETTAGWQPPPGGEYSWCRPVDETEVFDCEDAILLLSPRTIEIVTGAFARRALEGKHGVTVEDPKLVLFDHAFDHLLQSLGRDYELCFSRPWPDALPDAITTALQSVDLLAVDSLDHVAAEVAALITP